MNTEPKPDEKDAPEPKPDATPLAPGVWMTEATGFAAVPPRSRSDLGDVCEEKEQKQEREDEKTPAEPRIERYRER